MAGYTDRSDPGEAALTRWVMAGLMAAGAIWVGWMLGWPWVFELNDPDFNPLLLLELILIGLTVFYLAKAAIWQRRARAFGASELVVDGPVPVPLGRPLSGRLRVARPVRASGDWTLELSAHDIHETRDTRDHAAGPYRRDAYPTWSARINLPKATDAVHGLPYRFELPASVGPKPVRPLDRPNPYFRITASINVPGLRRVFSHNAPPVGRIWTLAATAPTESGTFRAEFIVPVEE